MMNKRVLWSLVLATLVPGLWGGVSWGITPGAPAAPVAATPTTAQATATTFNAAMQELTADDFVEREKASATLQAILNEQLRAQAELQQTVDQLTRAYAAQITALGQIPEPEAQARVAGLLEIQKGLVNWTAAVLEAPAEQRKSLLAWGCQAKVAPIIGKVYSLKCAQRVAGVKALGKLERVEDGGGMGVDWLLAYLLQHEDDSAVRFQVLASLYERKPQPVTVEALWKLALGGQQDASESSDSRGEFPDKYFKVNFPGVDPEQLPDFFNGEDIGDEVPLAAKVLIQFKDPSLERRLTELLKKQLKNEQLTPLTRGQYWYTNFHQLLATYQIKAAIPYLACMATSGPSDESTIDTDQRSWYDTNRTEALGTLLELAGLSPEEYHLYRMTASQTVRGEVWVTDTEAHEQEAVEQFHAWWKQHYKDYGLKRMPADLPKQEEGEESGGGGRHRGGVIVPKQPQVIPVPATATAPATAPTTEPGAE